MTNIGASPSRGSSPSATADSSKMKTLRIQLSVLAQDDEAPLLDLVTRVPGVVAALVDEPAAALEVVVSRDACAPLVEREVRDALWAGLHAPVAA